MTRDRSGDMAATDPAPDTTTVARELDADPDNLALFVDNHPNPSLDAVLSAAVVGRDPEEIGEDTRDTVGEWVAHRRRQWPGPRDEILRYLEQHGPASEHEVVLALEPIENRRHIRPTLARLHRTGTVDREDRADEAALFSL